MAEKRRFMKFFSEKDIRYNYFFLVSKSLGVAPPVDLRAVCFVRTILQLASEIESFFQFFFQTRTRRVQSWFAFERYLILRQATTHFTFFAESPRRYDICFSS